jgi:hypothetical protein
MTEAYLKRREYFLSRAKKKRAANPELYKLREKEARERNREKINQRKREKRAANLELARQKAREEYHANAESRKASSARWKDRNREQQVAYRGKRIKSIRATPVGREKHIVSSLIRQTMLTISDSKTGTRFDAIIGIPKEEFRKWVEAQFEPWMTWGNYGTVDGKAPSAQCQCWDLDHIIPISMAVTIDDVHRLNHHTNLRPLCSYVNRWRSRQRAQSQASAV